MGMNPLAEGLWERAKDSLRAARHLALVSPDAAASRAYYAAFYAVSAYFARQGRTFRKHSSVEAAVHRDLVKAGLWPKELGARYSLLVEVRSVADYGDLEHVSRYEAGDAIQTATDVLRAVAESFPELFGGLEGI